MSLGSQATHRFERREQLPNPEWSGEPLFTESSCLGALIKGERLHKMQVSATDGYVVVHSDFIARSELFLGTYVAMIPSAHLFASPLLLHLRFLQGTYRFLVGTR